MALPDYQQCMTPLLKMAATQPETTLQEARSYCIEFFGLSEEEQQQKIPSGTQTTISNRVGWARTFLKKADCLTYPKRGSFSITDTGKELLLLGEPITVALLKQRTNFQDNWSQQEPESIPTESGQEQLHASPSESFEQAENALKSLVLDDLQKKLSECSFEFFEKLVLNLLLKMDYGAKIVDAGRSTGRPGDGGIDGLIWQDELGIDVIYLQAKRWSGNVGSPEISRFAGSIDRKKGNKGVFITTSSFTDDAKDCAREVRSQIILIDGEMLTELMWKHDVGVKVESVKYEKSINLEFFEESSIF